MGNQHETLIPSRLEYVTSLSHQTDNSQFKSIIGFNAFVYNNVIDYIWVNIAYLSVVKKVGIVLSAKLAKIRGFSPFNEGRWNPTDWSEDTHWIVAQGIQPTRTPQCSWLPATCSRGYYSIDSNLTSGTINGGRSEAIDDLILKYQQQLPKDLTKSVKEKLHKE